MVGCALQRALVSGEELACPATLTLWPHSIDAKAVEPREMPSLHLALAEAMDALRTGNATPWIITSAGTILTPAVLRALMAES